MKRILLWVLTAGALAAGTLSSAGAQGGRGWPQWGRDARHHAPVAGQRLDRLLADIVYDPFAEQERAEQFGANSEDGNLYAIAQGGVEKQRIFLQLALGAAYTPLSIGPDGKIYTQNAGHLFVVGN
jgi:hypothetical protein